MADIAIEGAEAVVVVSAFELDAIAHALKSLLCAVGENAHLARLTGEMGLAAAALPVAPCLCGDLHPLSDPC
ncbi:hypothetical protein GCM10010193_57060 [Kitasatospora atroaurantiaca]|uniref:Uncharacterized protein n=1 Tax=Kitasatospora atroaurantiaca TaxID=285545 RepID=A0A561EMW4_9ACTN|nr:hypothetical protein [Kitasatospora atroaurantiaca]TWE16955.1 hypothetical protein FB465_1950 [Kitasatospora atroaurantiaca]